MKSILISITLCLLTTFTVAQPSHELLDDLLRRYVNRDGRVDYAGMREAEKQLDTYLALLEKDQPQPPWDQDAKKAYWINAYNAFTLKLILDNYPLESITDLHPLLYIPGINTVWHREFFDLGKAQSLDAIEHEILRKEFDDPRIHFAINCASVSCPVLRNEAYVAQRLDAQLNQQAVRFINSGVRNKITPHAIEISKIFDWFESDFTQGGSLIQFLNQYTNEEIQPGASIDYLDYDWRLNE